MTKEEIHQVFLDALNSVVKADPAAMGCLLQTRVPCRDAVLGETVMAVPGQLPNGQPVLGTLGIINGLAHALGIPRVAAHYDDELLVKFDTYRLGQSHG
jgi:hypothetical protein